MKQVFIRGRYFEGCASAFADLVKFWRLEASCLSIGTEYSAIKGSAVPMWRNLRAFKLVTASIAKIMVFRRLTRRFLLSPISNRLFSPGGSYYSRCRIFSVGDRVACAGGSYAYHAHTLQCLLIFVFIYQIRFLSLRRLPLLSVR